MRCRQCDTENPKQSKFCRKCGTSLGVRIRCPQCASENPGDSIFCMKCGESLSGVQKSVKGNQRKCRSCGHFNELEALSCVSCGEEIIKASREKLQKQSSNPSYKMIALVIGLVFVLGLSLKLGLTFFKEKRAPQSPSIPTSTSSQKPSPKVDEAQVIAVAKNFKCACGGCGELPLETCTCDMPKGAVEEKNFIREKLAEGFSVEQVVELVDKKYGHRK
ncbi:MAG: zinc ribbon domain-containing protein [Thermodesulfobacteriota bacterium]|nr:zinc ribbon domain-containing protein [Thermodesulfobacteriota bacterium]